MPFLRHLVVHFSDIDTRTEADHLGKWIRRLLLGCPIETLRLIPERKFKGPDVSLDGLAEHLRLKHANTLRVLRLDYTFVGIPALRALCASCPSLQELGIRTHPEVLVRQPDRPISLSSPMISLFSDTLTVSSSIVTVWRRSSCQPRIQGQVEFMCRKI